jgi:hypothetical protein
MTRWMQLGVTAALAVALACGGGSSTEAQSGVEKQVQDEVAAAKKDVESTEGATAGAPEVAEEYQSTINRGWEKAVAGENPAFACAGLKGRLIGTKKTDDPAARSALFACNVLIPVRYFETTLDQVDAGSKSCSDLMTAFMTELPAMTMSMGSLQKMADAAEQGQDAGEAAAEVVAGAVDAATVEKGLEDPKAAIKEQLADRVQQSCPDMAPYMLR